MEDPAGGTTSRSKRRLTIQICAEVLRSIHFVGKNSDHVTPYQVERNVGLAHARLKEILRQLEEEGLVDAAMHVTNKGYAFLGDFTSKIAPLLEKYGFLRT